MAQVYSDAALDPRATPPRARHSNAALDPDPTLPRAGQAKQAGARWEAEAQYLHRQLLGRAAPAALQQAYVRAHQLYGAQVEPCCLPRVMQRRLDVEAVELALRQRQPALTRKVQWVLTLAELHGDLHDGPAMHPLRAVWRLGLAALGAVMKSLRGRWLVWRHDLA